MNRGTFERSCIAVLSLVLVLAAGPVQASDNYTWDRKNFFPVGIYQYPVNYDGTTGSMVSQEDHMGEMWSSGFSLARIWHGSGGLQNNLDRIYYDTYGIPGVPERGLATLVDIDTRAIDAARGGHDSLEEHTLRSLIISQGDNHPGLFGWSSADEPGPGNLRGAATEQQLIDELTFITKNIIGAPDAACSYAPWDDSYLPSLPVYDPAPDKHPILLNLGSRDASAMLPPNVDYRDIANTFSTTWYPNYQAYKTPGGSSYPNTDRRGVGYYADQLQIFSAASDDVPTMMVLEAAGGLELSGNGTRPNPTPDPALVASRPNLTELRFDAYSSIIHGTNGILWYGLQYTNDPLVAGGNQLWDDVKSIASELGDSQVAGSTSDLKYALAENATTSDFVLGDSGLEATIKQWNGRQYLIVANKSYSGGAGQTVTNADITLTNWLGGQSEVKVLFEGGRTVATADGSFQDSFAPWEVHVYESSYETNKTGNVTIDINPTTFSTPEGAWNTDTGIEPDQEGIDGKWFHRPEDLGWWPEGGKVATTLPDDEWASTPNISMDVDPDTHLLGKGTYKVYGRFLRAKGQSYYKHGMFVWVEGWLDPHGHNGAPGGWARVKLEGDQDGWGNNGAHPITIIETGGPVDDPDWWLREGYVGEIPLSSSTKFTVTDNDGGWSRCYADSLRFELVHLFGDVTGDNFVGADDLVAILTHWGQSGMTREQGDLTGEGFVGSDDYVEVLTYWGQGSGSGEPIDVPEPTTLIVLSLAGGLVALLHRRRK